MAIDGTPTGFRTSRRKSVLEWSNEASGKISFSRSIRTAKVEESSVVERRYPRRRSVLMDLDNMENNDTELGNRNEGRRTSRRTHNMDDYDSGSAELAISQRHSINMNDDNNDINGGEESRIIDGLNHQSSRSPNTASELVNEEGDDNVLQNDDGEEEDDEEQDQSYCRYPFRTRKSKAQVDSSESEEQPRRTSRSLRRSKSRRSSRQHRVRRHDELEEEDVGPGPGYRRYSFRNREKAIRRPFTITHDDQDTVSEGAEDDGVDEQEAELIREQQRLQNIQKREERLERRRKLREGLSVDEVEIDDANNAPEVEEGPRRYSLRNRKKLQRPDPIVDYQKNGGREGGSFQDYAKRVVKRTVDNHRSRRRGTYGGHSRRSRSRRYYRTHYDSSSESSVASGDSSDAGFRLAEKKRRKRELNSICPVNGFGSKNLSKDARRADAAPIEIDKSITWDSVGGLTKHVEALKEMVMLPLLYPEFFEKFSISPPCGVLFYGPPGTGKTLLARALANSCSSEHGQHVSFFMRKGADCLSKWVGEAERQLRLLFEQAKRAQPSIIFFDEIDGLAPVRSTKQDQIHASIVSTLLALMDGLDKRGQVVVIGATNRVDAVDPALRRPGRFDRELAFTLPSVEDRKHIFSIHTLSWNPPMSNAFKQEIAEMTMGYCGADMKALCSEAAICSLKRHYPQVYLSNDKLKIDISNIKISRGDFEKAMTSITPASYRSVSTVARPLPFYIKFLLDASLFELCENIARIYPVFRLDINKMKPKKDYCNPSSFISIASKLQNSGSKKESIYGVMNRDVCESCSKTGKLICCDRCPSAFHLECIDSSLHPAVGSNLNMEWLCQECRRNSSSVDPKSTSVIIDTSSPRFHHHARLLICGKKGMGQSYLGPAALHLMERFMVFNIDLPCLISDTCASSLEESLVRKVSEARKNSPCVIYLPRISKWWNNASGILQSTLIMLLNDIPLNLPILFFCTSNVPAMDLSSELLDIFNYSLNINKARMDLLTFCYDMLPPRNEMRKCFFNSIFADALIPPAENGGEMCSTATMQLEVVPASKKDVGPSKDELEVMREKDMHYLRELRVFLDKVLEFCFSQKRYAIFMKPVDENEVPDYYLVIKNPMDLGTMYEKLNDGEYSSFELFMDDIRLIVRNAQEFNPKHSATRDIAHAACNLQDNVLSFSHRFIKVQGYDLFGKCRDISKRLKRTNKLNVHGIRGLAKGIPAPSTPTKDLVKGRRSARLRGEAAPEVGDIDQLNKSKDQSQSVHNLEEDNVMTDVSNVNSSERFEHDSTITTDVANENNPSKSFKIGDSVFVAARTNPGINKLGGPGRVSAVNGNQTYNIKYILGGSEKNVSPEYIEYLTDDKVTNSIKMTRQSSLGDQSTMLKSDEKTEDDRNNEFFDNNIWPVLKRQGWTRSEEIISYQDSDGNEINLDSWNEESDERAVKQKTRSYFLPPGITLENGVPNEDYFVHRQQVLAYIRSDADLAAKCFGKRYVEENLDSVVPVRNESGSAESNLLNSELNMAEHEESKGIDTTNDSCKRSCPFSQSSTNTTLSLSEEPIVVDTVCSLKRPRLSNEGVEDKKIISNREELIIDSEKLSQLRENVVIKTDGWSTQELHSLQLQFAKVIGEYTSVYDRSQLVQELESIVNSL